MAYKTTKAGYKRPRTRIVCDTERSEVVERLAELTKAHGSQRAAVEAAIMSLEPPQTDYAWFLGSAKGA